MQYTKDNPLRLFEVCAGYGSQALALKRLQEHYPDFAFKLVGWCDFDPESNQPIDKQPAVIAHNALHPEGIGHNYGDLTKMDWTQVPDFDLLTYSTPCLTEDSLILTNQGYKQLSDIVEGDVVLTKSNTFHPILKKFDNGIHQTCYIHGTAFDEIHCTLNHKFWARVKFRKGHKGIRTFKEPEFVQAKDLTRNHYLGFPVNNESVPFITEELDFWYMVGMYIGDGWLPARESDNDIIIACNKVKEEKLRKHLDQSKWRYTIQKGKTCNRFRFCNKEMQDIIREQFGTGCCKKHIPYDVVRMPIPQLEAFLEGYIDSDGCRPMENYIQFSTVNRSLAYSIQQIVAKVYHRVTSITKVKVKPYKEIEGRIVHQKPWYLLRAKLINNKQDNAFYEDGYIWYNFHRMDIAEEEHVYNIEVDEDHSYVVNGCISKNCQSISAAGLQHGFAEGSGTRSSIIWNVRDAVKIKRPKYLMLENVKAMVSKKFLPMFNLWQQELERMGYVNFAKVLNAKDFGVPQNRERIFMISIRADGLEGLAGHVQYHFPKPFPLERRLKDILEEHVDEKYYLSDKMLEYFNRVNDDKSHCHNFKPQEGGAQPLQ